MKRCISHYGVVHVSIGDMDIIIKGDNLPRALSS
jgi:hypothetical protein